MTTCQALIARFAHALLPGPTQGVTAAVLMAETGMTVSAPAMLAGDACRALGRPFTRLEEEMFHWKRETEGRSAAAEARTADAERRLEAVEALLGETREELNETQAAFATHQADTAALLAALTQRLETVEGLTLDD